MEKGVMGWRVKIMIPFSSECQVSLKTAEIDEMGCN
jgi:hypothetical protein